MTMDTIAKTRPNRYSISEARDKLGEIMDRVTLGGEVITIQRGCGQPGNQKVAIVDYDAYEAMVKLGMFGRAGGLR